MEHGFRVIPHFERDVGVVLPQYRRPCSKLSQAEGMMALQQRHAQGTTPRLACIGSGQIPGSGVLSLAVFAFGDNTG